MIVPSGARQIIRAEMVRCGFTVESLSDAAQISTIVLLGILRGRARSISTRNLCALARAFGYETGAFVDLLMGLPSPSGDFSNEYHS